MRREKFLLHALQDKVWEPLIYSTWSRFIDTRSVTTGLQYAGHRIRVKADSNKDKYDPFDFLIKWKVMLAWNLKYHMLSRTQQYNVS